jgi:hypothetical protein
MGAIHPMAMLVLLTTPDETDTWLEAPWEIARELQHPLPYDGTFIVSKGNRKDPAQLPDQHGAEPSSMKARPCQRCYLPFRGQHTFGRVDEALAA